MNETIVAWLAGFFDGEGSIHIRRAKPRYGTRSRPHHSLGVSITQKNIPLLEEIQKLLGFGYVYKRKKEGTGTPTYFCVAKGALKFLQLVLPYLKVKRMQARYGIQFQEGKEGKPGKPISNKELRWREMHKQLISLYNGR